MDLSETPRARLPPLKLPPLKLQPMTPVAATMPEAMTLAATTMPEAMTPAATTMPEAMTLAAVATTSRAEPLPDRAQGPSFPQPATWLKRRV